MANNVLCKSNESQQSHPNMFKVKKNIYQLGAWCHKQHLTNNNDGARMKIGWVIHQCNYGHRVG